MKTRNGFVSNSSSSSFIITIAEITNREKFDKFVNERDLKVDEWDFLILSNSDFIEMEARSRWGTCLENGDWAGYYGGTDTVKEFFKKNPVAEICIKTGTGPDGDHMFIDEGDEWGCCDYDNIELDDFETVDQDFYNGFDGMNIIENFYGAGRNG